MSLADSLADDFKITDDTQTVSYTSVSEDGNTSFDIDYADGHSLTYSEVIASDGFFAMGDRAWTLGNRHLKGSFSDSFARADSSTLGDDWTTLASGIGITGQKATGQGVSPGRSLIAGYSAGNVSVTATFDDTGANFIGLAVRYNSTSGLALGTLFVPIVPGVIQGSLGYFEGGTFTLVGTTYTVSTVTTSALRLAASGDRVSVYIDGVAVKTLHQSDYPANKFATGSGGVELVLYNAATINSITTSFDSTPKPGDYLTDEDGVVWEILDTTLDDFSISWTCVGRKQR